MVVVLQSNVLRVATCWLAFSSILAHFLLDLESNLKMLALSVLVVETLLTNPSFNASYLTSEVGLQILSTLALILVLQLQLQIQLERCRFRSSSFMF